MYLNLCKIKIVFKMSVTGFSECSLYPILCVFYAVFRFMKFFFVDSEIDVGGSTLI